MCGITGIVHADPSRPVDASVIDRMTDCLEHRGPDDRGIYASGPIGLGFRRLSIIDLSSAGAQPMSNEDEKMWLVFNGEIYNFKALRDELQGMGHRFKSQTDSEVVLHGYEEWGKDVVDHLDGMFAFAVWDSANDTILVARDPFGIKPLHYAMVDEGLVFASEIKGLLQCPYVSRSIDTHALWNYLTFAQVPAPETIYADIRKLPPGHRIISRSGHVTLEQYYKPPPPDDALDAVEAGRRLVEELERAVQSHLVADVPVGCFLSGGIDSSLISALAARNMSGRLKTFSVSFTDSPDQDESEYQQLMARALDSEHHVVDAKTDLASGTDAILQATDEPFAISSFLPLYFVSRLAANHVKVVLSGDGADELFGGYGMRYVNDDKRRWLGRMMRWLPPPHDPDDIWCNRATASRLRRRAYLAATNEHDRYISSFNWFWHPEKRVLLQPAILEGLDGSYGSYLSKAYDERTQPALLRKMTYEFGTSLSDEMLTKVDRATSAVSIEGRVPFLDRSFAEYAWSVPTRHKWKAGEGKLLLKNAIRGLIPDEIIDRPKGGFNVPLSRWIRDDKTFLRPVLLEESSKFNEYVRPNAIRAMLDAHDAEQGEHGERLWVIYVLKCWFMREVSL